MRHRLCFILLISVIFCEAQNPRFDDDAAIWANIYLEKKLSRKLDIHLNQQNRINNNISVFNQAYADLGLTWNFNKKVKVLVDYVFADRRRDDGSYGVRHQAYLALVLRQKYRRFTMMYRNMLQGQINSMVLNPETGRPVYYDRNKFTVKYALNKRFSFYVAEEIWYPFYQAKNKGFDRSRSFAGMFYAITKKSELEFYFAYQQELHAYHLARRVFIYGIGYSREF